MPFTSVYLDHAATTPMREAALQAYTEAALRVGNPSSLHRSGRSAQLHLEDARDALAATVGAHPSEVILTGGGTEADNLALKGLFWARRGQDSRRRRIVLTGLEHHAVLDTADWLHTHEGAELEFVAVTPDGTVDLEAWRTALHTAPETIAVATLMWANNEIGTIQPVAEAAALAAEAGVPFHTDAVQAVGSIPVDFAASGATTLAFSGHKLGGPVGIGALLVRRDAVLTPVQHGGGQERQIRSGTLPTALTAGFAAAAQEAHEQLPVERERLGGLRDQLIAGIRSAVGNAVLRGAEDTDPATGEQLLAGTRRLPGNVHFTFPGCQSDSLLFGLDTAGVECSAGSACTAGVAQPSHVILGLGLDEDTASSALRMTLGHTSSPADVEKLLEVLPGVHAAALKAGASRRLSSIRTANSHRNTTSQGVDQS